MGESFRETEVLPGREQHMTACQSEKRWSKSRKRKRAREREKKTILGPFPNSVALPFCVVSRLTLFPSPRPLWMCIPIYIPSVMWLLSPDQWLHRLCTAQPQRKTFTTQTEIPWTSPEVTLCNSLNTIKPSLDLDTQRILLTGVTLLTTPPEIPSSFDFRANV